MKVRILQLLAVMTTCLSLSGCLPSLYPLYTEDDLIFSPELLGIWQEPDDDMLWYLKRVDPIPTISPSSRMEKRQHSTPICWCYRKRLSWIYSRSIRNVVPTSSSLILSGPTRFTRSI